jgi:hypothetical protein
MVPSIPSIYHVILTFYCFIDARVLPNSENFLVEDADNSESVISV